MNATIDLDDAEGLLAADRDGALQAASMAGSQVRAVGTAIAEGALEPLRSEDRSRAVVWVSGRGTAATAGAILAGALADTVSLPFVTATRAPVWVGPLDVMVIAGDDAGDPALSAAVSVGTRRGARVVIAAPDSDLDAIIGAVPGDNRFEDGVEESDVLGRYMACVNNHPGTSIVVRITADCPCLDYRLIQRAVEAIQAGHDYAGNTVERKWPRGLDVESFTTELLLRAHQTATDPYDREHVTPWMQRHASSPYSMPRTAEDALGATEALRWTLDTANDYRWLKDAFRQFPNPTTSQLLSLPPRYD